MQPAGCQPEAFPGSAVEAEDLSDFNLWLLATCSRCLTLGCFDEPALLRFVHVFDQVTNYMHASVA
jgi:hypothetical protein